MDSGQAIIMASGNRVGASLMPKSFPTARTQSVTNSFGIRRLPDVERPAAGPAGWLVHHGKRTCYISRRQRENRRHSIQLHYASQWQRG